MNRFSNFGKDLLEMSENEVRQGVNNWSADFSALGVQELTRRQLLKLDASIAKLTRTIHDSARKSSSLETSNYRLQIVMLILTSVTTVAATFPAIRYLLNLGTPLIAEVLNAPSLRNMDWTLWAATLSLIVGASVMLLSKVFVLDGDFIVFRRKPGGKIKKIVN